MKTKIYVLLLLLCGMVWSVEAADRVKGDGKLTTKKISIDDYNKIKIDEVIDFYYVQSDSPSTLEVTTDQNLHDYVYIEVKNRVLTVSFKGAKVDHFTKFIVKTNSKWLSEAKVNGNANFVVNSPLKGDETKISTSDTSVVQVKHLVTVGKLDLNVMGSANVVIDRVETDKIECDVDGSGSVTIKNGKAKVGNYNIISSGDIHAFGLAVPELNCKVTGGGLAEVHPTDNLKVTVIGKGRVRYKGPTAVQQRVIGKGTVEEVK